MQDQTKPFDANSLTAVILAAGSGTRIQQGKVPEPKPLIRLGGLCLGERAVLTLKQAGIKKFRIVTGAYADQVESKLKSLKSLHGLEIEYVRCPTYEKGNGESLGAGTEGVTGAFVVVMADHVFSPNGVKDFIAAVAPRADAPYLATDQQIAQVFDLDDATKVTARDGKIVEIGKELSKYNEIDTGLFYFPPGASQFIQQARTQGATSVSDIVKKYVRELEFRTHVLPADAFWQDVDTPSMAREAERKMMKSLRKHTDGFISKKLNRNISGPISRVLTNLGVSPSTVTTFVFLISCYAAYLASTGEYVKLAIAGLIFQFASIVDGCDGEIARLAYKHTSWGAWYDTLTDNVRYGLFFAAMGIGVWHNGGPMGYVWGAVFFFFMLFFHVSLMIKFEMKTRQTAGTHLVVTQSIGNLANQKKTWWDRNIVALRGLVKQDVSALGAMFFCLLGWQKPLFFLGGIGLLAMLISVLRILPVPEGSRYPKFAWLKDLAPFVYFSIGFALLIYLLDFAPKAEILAALSQVGPSAWWAFALAVLWLAVNAWSLIVIAQKNFGLVETLSTWIITDALNAVVPLAGVAGEPYKAKFLASKMPWPEAWGVVFKDKIIHIIAGYVFTGGIAILCLFFNHLEGRIFNLVLLAGIVMLALGLAFYLLGTSKTVNHMVRRVLGKVKFLDSIEVLEHDRGIVLLALGWKIIGRALNMAEIAAYLYLLNLPISIGNVLLLNTFVSASGLIFFVIPQGIGVAELSLTAAFGLMGVSSADAIAFGLLRRARILIWSFIGIGLLAIFSLSQHLRSSTHAEAQT